ncbi:hypothetical protein [Marisediminicola sp. LYQ134]|uniref:hypothetical protein n=1 Tax=unclassified Marisediminicola TaxID=2618316 RepID=UPI0039831F14
MNPSTKWSLGGVIGLVVLALLVWFVLDAVFGVVFFLVRVVVLVIVVGIAAIILRRLFTRSRGDR